MINKRYGRTKRPEGTMLNENPVRSAVIAGCVAVLAATTLPSRADAMTAAMCAKYGDHCLAGCDQRSIGKDICIKRCVKAQSDCIIHSKPTTGQNAPSISAPLNPKGGGTKAEPKAPPSGATTAPVATNTASASKTPKGIERIKYVRTWRPYSAQKP